MLPDPSWVERDTAVLAIRDAGFSVLEIDAPVESKAVCAALIGVDLAPPLVVVARGDACLTLPAVALSLRTQHKDTAGYVLVDPDAPPSTDTWPEAPVTVVSATGESSTSLRGWEIFAAPDGVPSGIAAVVGRILGF